MIKMEDLYNYKVFNELVGSSQDSYIKKEDFEKVKDKEYIKYIVDNSIYFSEFEHTYHKTRRSSLFIQNDPDWEVYVGGSCSARPLYVKRTPSKMQCIDIENLICEFPTKEKTRKIIKPKQIDSILPKEINKLDIGKYHPELKEGQKISLTSGTLEIESLNPCEHYKISKNGKIETKEYGEKIDRVFEIDELIAFLCLPEDTTIDEIQDIINKFYKIEECDSGVFFETKKSIDLEKNKSIKELKLMKELDDLRKKE